MKINVNEELTSLDGSILIDESGKPLTVKNVLTISLISPTPNESLSGDEKYAHYDLSKRVHEAEPDLNVTVDEAVILKKRVGLFYGALVYGRIVDIIEKERE